LYFITSRFVFKYILSKLFLIPSQSNTDPITAVSNENMALELFTRGFSPVFLAPVFEEIFFRGFLLNALSQFVSPFLAITFSAAFFAVVHFQPNVLFSQFLVGIVLGAVYWQNKNLASSILMHSLWNLSTLISLLVAKH
jgi:uncharacterized protein